MATPTIAPQLKTVEEIREILYKASPDTDPFIWETPAWQWADAEAYGAARALECEYERARR